MKFVLQDCGKEPPGKWFLPVVLLILGLVISVQTLLPASLQVRCLFRQWSGIPCPTCGGTRCVQQILHGDFVSAFQMQPLGFVAVFAVGAVLLYLSIAGLTGLPVVRIRTERRRERLALVALLLLSMGINWLYLIARR